MNNYIDNTELEEELEKWRLSADKVEDRMPSERLGQMLLSMHDGVLRHKNFNKYRQDLKEEMKSYSLYRILKCGLKSFDKNRAKAFSYFTRSIFMNYITIVMRYYRRLNMHQEYVKGELMRLAESGDPTICAYVEHFQTSDWTKDTDIAADKLED